MKRSSLIDIGGGLVGVVAAGPVFEVARVIVDAVFAGETLRPA